MEYVNLHCHSDFSLLDGLSKPKQIAKRAKSLGYKAAAITDHGSIASGVSFIKACNKEEIKPILGSEFYLCPQDSLKKDAENRKLSHLCILAKNLEGWRSLIKATSFANHPDRYYYKPRLQLDDFAQFSGNLIAFSGHMGSDLANVVFAEPRLAYGTTEYEDARMLVHDDWYDRVKNLAGKYREIFGKDNFWVEIQLIDHLNLPAAVVVAKILRHVAKKEGYNCLATADSHYPTKEDAPDQRVLLCTAFETTLPKIRSQLDNAEEVGLGAFFRSNNYHIPSLQEVQEVNEKDEINNTSLVAEMCETYNILGKPKLPDYPCPAGKSQKDYLKELCLNNWDKKVPPDNDEYKQRFSSELDVINSYDVLTNYFLIVQDWCDHFRKKGMLLGVGRGSAAGCLTATLLGITNVDPIKYDLMFERFYNAGRNTADRVSLPDIDCDFPAYARAEVIEYIKNKYGSDNVSQMVTFSRMQGRGALKDVLRAHEACSFEEMNKITEFVPDESEISDDLQEMREAGEEASIIRWALENEAEKLKQWCFIDEAGELQGQYSKLFAQAIRLEGTKRSQGKHAAGVIISGSRLADICPMVLDKKHNTQIAGMEMNDLEAIGLVKFDILGINLLDKLECLRQIISEVRCPV